MYIYLLTYNYKRTQPAETLEHHSNNHHDSWPLTGPDAAFQNWGSKL